MIDAGRQRREWSWLHFPIRMSALVAAIGAGPGTVSPAWSQPTPMFDFVPLGPDDSRLARTDFPRLPPTPGPPRLVIVPSAPSYPLPLRIDIESVTLANSPEREFIVEVVVRNVGEESFFMPAAMDRERARLAPGNRDRRLLVFHASLTVPWRGAAERAILGVGLVEERADDDTGLTRARSEYVASTNRVEVPLQGRELREQSPNGTMLPGTGLVPVLDLTDKPWPLEELESRNSAPVISRRVVNFGDVPAPAPPLEVSIEDVRPGPGMGTLGSVIVDLRIENTGEAAYNIPRVLDPARMAPRFSTREATAFGFWTEFRAEGRAPARSLAVMTYESPDDPESWIRLRGGEAIVVRFETGFYRIWDWAEEGVREVEMAVEVRKDGVRPEPESRVTGTSRRSVNAVWVEIAP